MVSACFLATVLAVSATPDVTLLSFSADWCQACQGVKPVVQRMMQDRYPVREVNVDREPELVSRFRVTSVPCFVLVVDGREVERVSESASYARLAQLFDRLVAPSAQMSSAVGSAQPLVRGQSEDGGRGFGLPQPLAALARNFGPPQPNRPSSSGPAEIAHPTAVNPVRPDATGALAVSGSPTGGPPPSPSANLAGGHGSVHDRALRATVRLRVDDLNGHSVGTGTIIDTHGNEALVITCGHLFRDSSGKGRIAVDLFADGQARTVGGTLISYDLERDLGLVAISTPIPLSPARVAAPGFRFERSQAVFSIGCDRAADPTVQVTRITGIDRYVGPPNIEVAGQPVDGRSGGGLFSIAGELIGVCNAADPSDNEGIFASLPAVHWELDRIGQRRIYEPQTMPSAAANQQLVSTELRAASVASSSRPGLAPAAEAAVLPGMRGMGAGNSANAAISPQPPHPTVAIDSQPPGQRSATAMTAPPTDDTEVICIVRSRANPQGPQHLIVLDRPSPDLLARLTAESRIGPAVAVAQQPPPAAPPSAGFPARPESIPQPVVRAQSNSR